jgi:hypothetical protein
MPEENEDMHRNLKVFLPSYLHCQKSGQMVDGMVFRKKETPSEKKNQSIKEISFDSWKDF